MAYSLDESNKNLEETAKILASTTEEKEALTKSQESKQKELKQAREFFSYIVCNILDLIKRFCGLIKYF